MIRVVSKVNRFGNHHSNFDHVTEISVFQGKNLVAATGYHNATDKGLRVPFEKVFDSCKIDDLRSFYKSLGRSKSDLWMKEAIKTLHIKGLNLEK